MIIQLKLQEQEKNKKRLFPMEKKESIVPTIQHGCRAKPLYEIFPYITLGHKCLFLKQVATIQTA